MNIINRSRRPKSLSPTEFDNYLSKGWYRMHQYIFSISHLLDFENFVVNRVWWLRFNVANIQSHRSHRRIRKLNAGFEVVIEKFTSVSE